MKASAAPIRIRTTLALLAAIAAGALALGQGVSVDLHLPAAQLIAAECQGFEALASVGQATLTCDADRGAQAPVVAPGVSSASDLVPPQTQRRA